MATTVGPYAAPAGSAAPVVAPPPSGLADFSMDYKNYIPDAGFWSYLQNLGMTGSSPIDKYAQQRQSNYYGQYMAAAADNPNLGFFDYLNQKQFNPEAEFNAQSPDQRFDFTSRSLTPRARWSVAG